MCSVLHKDIIELELVLLIPKSKCGFFTGVPSNEIINAIL